MDSCRLLCFILVCSRLAAFGLFWCAPFLWVDWAFQYLVMACELTAGGCLVGVFDCQFRHVKSGIACRMLPILACVSAATQVVGILVHDPEARATGLYRMNFLLDFVIILAGMSGPFICQMFHADGKQCGAEHDA